MLKSACSVFDSLGTSAFSDKIYEKYRIPREEICYNCTHNHMIPGARYSVPTANLPQMPLCEGMAQWTDLVIGAAFDCIEEALHTLRPARIGAGHGISGLGVNRDWMSVVGPLGTGDRNGETDDRLAVLRIDTVEGEPIAILVNHSSHSGSSLILTPINMRLFLDTLPRPDKMSTTTVASAAA